MSGFKKALNFSEAHKEAFANNIQVQTVIELHKWLADGLFDYGLRERLVGITGSVYKPLGNKFQLEDELKKLCDVINAKQNVYEKALLAFTYVCYLQPFNDGNKRTDRILAFYELGNLGNAKAVFTDQAKFAAENYAI